jgi:hypothetical protein
MQIGEDVASIPLLSPTLIVLRQPLPTLLTGGTSGRKIAEERGGMPAQLSCLRISHPYAVECLRRHGPDPGGEGGQRAGAALMADHPEAPTTILRFWFSETQPRQWFVKDPAFDALVRDRFLGLTRQAIAGELAAWTAEATGGLALVLLLDQFPRQIWR